MAIDHFLTSLAVDQKSRAIGILLSGTASDGVVGMESVKAEGGITFAQDERSAKYPEMPKNAIMAGCVDLVLPPEGIAKELLRITRHPYVAQAVGERDLDESLSEASKSFLRLFELLRKSSQADFTHYKRATIKRRIARRMALHKVQTLDEYVQILNRDPKELHALYQDLLIKVTGFFRDPGSFLALRAKIFPAMEKDRPRNVPLRIWVPGCSTGEEAYSIAIALVEYMSATHANIPCQIFATDLSEVSIERARAGVYLEHIVADLSPERLRRFFTKVDGGYQIAKPIRDMCVVARQDLIKDPPFSKLDLISCRNVLIYLEPLLHRKVFPMFHYALRPGGYLMLGVSETVGTFSNLFQIADRKAKIYSRRPISVPVQFDLPVPEIEAPDRPPAPAKPAPSAPRESDVQKEVDRLILRKFTPSGVVVDDNAEILQFRGQTDPYLQPAPGKASLNLLKMAREGLLFELRATFHRARKQGSPARSEPIPVSHHGRTWDVRVEVIPLASSDGRARQFLVLFEEGQRAAEGPRGKPVKKREIDRHVEQLRQELSATKEHLQSIIEEQETTNEELKSANEEILSSNEELQSTNEELETAKEELQSTNEELTTLNEELQNRNAELIQANNDISNLLSSVSIPIVMLGNDLRIRRFTPMTEKLMNLIATDIGRPITDIRSNIEVPHLQKMIVDAIETVSTQEKEARDKDNRWWLVRVRPYRTRENKIDGAVLMFLDIEDHKRTTKGLSNTLEYAETLFELVHDAVLLLDADLRVRHVNQVFYRMFQLSQQETNGRQFHDLGGGEWELPELRAKLERVIPDNASFQDHLVELALPRLAPPARRTYLVSARRTGLGDSTDPVCLVTISETTPR
jgi:two-component system CheB/CheR fusion protein